MTTVFAGEMAKPTDIGTFSPWRSTSKGEPSPRREFWLVLVLFVGFRMMALLAFRPGGQVLDFSDFYWYREFAELTRQGYFPSVNLWSPYPPLFPLLMVGLWWVSSLLPPWEFPNLWFTLLLGGVFLLFEAGNLVLLYAIAGRVADRRAALRSAWFYALLFVPVYTLTGWFESFPLFFFLLGLYLLLCGRPLWSAAVGGVGFMIKILPAILLPVGLRLPRQDLTSSRSPLSLQGDGGKQVPTPLHSTERGTGGEAKRRLVLPWLNLTLDLRHALLYLGTFAMTIVAIEIPLHLLNPRLAWGWPTVSSTREPWETVWALLEGQFGYGVAPLDMRDLSWQPAYAASSLPWPLITLAFAAVFLFVYTRRFDWRHPRHVVAFTGFTVVLFMLYSKGYSPQWLVWVLAFVVLLLPNLRGAFYAVVVSLVNLIEGLVFFTVLPDEHWLLIVTVGLRTLIFTLVGIECLFVLWPKWLTPAVRRARCWLLIGLAAVLTVGSVPAGVRFIDAYFDVRYQLSPYRATIEALRVESQPGDALILTSYDHRAYDWLYPYLRDRLAFTMLDDYAPPGESVEARTLATLGEIASQHRDWWFFDSDPTGQTPSEQVMAGWLEMHATLVISRDLDKGRLYHYSLK